MSKAVRKKLPFDPIDEAARQWGLRWDAVDRLEAAGHVVRRPHPDDGRAVLAEITDSGRAVVEAATADLVGARFALAGVPAEQLRELSAMLKPLRHVAGDF
jgi:DNA-binding MarR family transcriptional regulator